MRDEGIKFYHILIFYYIYEVELLEKKKERKNSAVVTPKLLQQAYLKCSCCHM